MALRLSASQHRFIEGNQGLADLVNRNDCATIEPTQRGASSTARASEIHEARIALFSAIVSVVSFVTSVGWI
jgi:hypothetical protein